MAKRGRGQPPIKIDLEQARKLASLFCTDEELAAFFKCSTDTIEKRRKIDPLFRRAIEEGRANGALSLRRSQTQAALKGNPTMLIWMGKQYLEQKDKVATELTGKDGKPLQQELHVHLHDKPSES